MYKPERTPRTWVQLLDPSLLIALGSVVGVLLVIEMLGRAGWIQVSPSATESRPLAPSALWVQQRELVRLCDSQTGPALPVACEQAQRARDLVRALHAEAALPEALPH